MLPTLSYECSEYLIESNGKPLIKNLPRNLAGFSKVKVRHRRSSNKFIESFNGAFTDERSKLLQRSIFAHGEKSFIASEDSTREPFYIFPVDGFRYMYNPSVATTTEYEKTFETLVSNIGQSAPDLFQKVLKYDYIFDRLADGISGGSEIIIYGIPYYFALRKSLIDDYSNFFRS